MGRWIWNSVTYMGCELAEEVQGSHEYLGGD